MQQVRNEVVYGTTIEMLHGEHFATELHEKQFNVMSSSQKNKQFCSTMCGSWYVEYSFLKHYYNLTFNSNQQILSFVS